MRGHYFTLCARCTGIYTGDMICFILFKALPP
ncbi:MAG TPA: DUF2085 domain-containing protein [Methanothermobacter sp.]|nr:DUF2085 domain-containing protein [Methanothermobacter sp.]